MSIYHRTINPINSRPWYTALSLVAGLTISSCGGGGGGNPGPTVDPIVNETSTEELLNSASNNIGGSLDTALDGVSRVTSGGGSSDGTIEDPADTGVGGLWGNDAQNLVNTSLDLGDESNTVREGSRITIDPDDAAVCSEELVGMSADDAEFQRCQALVSDMTVQIDATNDNDGTLSYLYQDQPLVVIAYTPTSNSFELNLGTLKVLIDANNDLYPDGGSESPLDTIRGALRVSAEATNTTSGSEAGSVAVEVSQALAIVSADANTNLSLGVGKIFGFTADAATESASIELAIGALQASENSDGTTNSIGLDGLTAIIDFANNSDQLTVRNLGVGDGPLRIALNNSEVLNLGLDTFGFTLATDDNSGEPLITLDGQLNLRMLVREVFDDNTVSDTLFDLLEMTAPAGTQIGEQLNGSQRVLTGGPFSYSMTTQDDNGNQVIEQVTVEAGQCADDSEIVPCE